MVFNQIADSIKSELEAHMRSTHGMSEADTEKAFDIGKSTITDTLKTEVMNGNINGIVSMFTQAQPVNTDNSIVARLVQNYAAALTQKTAMDTVAAGAVAGSVIPLAANKLKSAFNGSGYSQDMNGLADFLGIDKTLLHLASSPIGKLFGKFKK